MKNISKENCCSDSNNSLGIMKRTCYNKVGFNPEMQGWLTCENQSM